ncbi:LytTR family DNA-binding domain-containing protein [Ruegeria sp. Ofav3-42]|uniref:LytTR family DNA-binding domain-containing protein n=1 Tax=Ruegeria sp. Ofav3-42 TaxID=2917759 RepID=UPI001EF47C56|nr:LytTR family DNA-binding domain-containing protein [Ruegeria sp. Ofav3-42]MCG7518717.1 LytTR family transcriptional regulator [Ruegeria sp. Ofav3-42]
MTSKLSLDSKVFSPQRVVAGFVFLPMLAYTFPPFMVSELPFVLRLLFWIGVMAIALTSTWMSRKLFHETQAGLKVPARDLMFALLVLVLFIPSLWALAWLLFSFGGYTAPGIPRVVGYSTLFTAGLILMRQVEPKSEPTPPLAPRLTRRLPASFQGQVYRLTSRNHYVDVVTSEGTFTIRSRFTDAIAEMEPLSGHCAHRSHWVADEAIIGTKKADERTYLKLVNGDLVPVSRKYKPMLEEDGLI